MELVTGRSGSPHVTSQQDRQLHQGIFGDGAYILNTGNMLEPEVQSSNSIHIKDGALMFQGALFSVKVGTYDEVTINNGNQGMKRKDVIAVKYTYDSSQNIESGEWTVVQGTPVTSNPVVPDMPVADGDIQAGDSEVYCPVFVVTLDGINVTGVDIIPEMMQDMSTINKYLSDNFRLSSTEIATHEKWIDGKRIYSMTIVANDTIPAGGDLTIPLSLSVADRLWIDPQNSYIRSATQCFPLPLPKFSVSDDSYVGIWVNTAGIRLYSNAGWNEAWEKCITLRYTKKTDY